MTTSGNRLQRRRAQARERKEQRSAPVVDTGEDGAGQTPGPAQTRQQAFMEGMADLERRYGYQCYAEMRTEVLGPVLQVRIIMNVVEIPGWQPPQTNEVVPPGTIVEEE